MSSDEGKWNAEDAFRGLQGIERVLNETRVVTQALGQPPQADIARPWFPERAERMLHPPIQRVSKAESDETIGSSCLHICESFSAS